MIDFDGVLADLDSAFVRAVNDKFDEDFRVEDVTDWQFWRKQGKDIADYVWGELFPDADWLLEHVEPYEGAMAAFADLTSDPAIDSVCVVTARARDHESRVSRWVFKHIPANLRNYGYGITAVGKEPKIETCKRYDLTHIVDDGPHNLSPFNPLRSTLYLVNRPHNASYPDRPYLNRVDSLQDAVDHAYGEVTV